VQQQNIIKNILFLFVPKRGTGTLSWNTQVNCHYLIFDHTNFENLVLLFKTKVW